MCRGVGRLGTHLFLGTLLKPLLPLPTLPLPLPRSLRSLSLSLSLSTNTVSAPAPAAEHQQRQSQQQQQPVQVAPPRFHPPQFERRLSRTSSHSWYSQNQGGSVSYHPSPVQEKAEYFPVVQVSHPPPSHPAAQAPSTDRRQYDSAPYQSQPQHQHGSVSAYGHANGGGSAVVLPHFHDNVWAKPPAIVLARHASDEDERGRQMAPTSALEQRLRVDISSASNSRSCSSGTGTSGRSASTCASAMSGTEDDDGYASEDVDGEESEIPSAPFANAGPAGVYVPFGSEYARYQGQQQYYGQPAPSSAVQYHHQQAYPQPHHPQQQHHHQQNQYATQHQQYESVYHAPSTSSYGYQGAVRRY
ncbi:hypothetical protein NMY22_g15501 [Coprinellus aureogranulatus]|nr:hypothetical protein NMY22_g15501 [Coprinellus aureogranulatus]